MDVLHLHLARAFALYAAIAARYDQEPAGPTYEEAELLAELEAVKGPSCPQEGGDAWQA